MARTLGALAIAAIAAASGPGAADDTEIYIGLEADASRTKPNVLFVIDTSGSMNSEVVKTTAYDPGATYAAGPNGECGDDDVVYFSTGDVPGCDRSNARFPRGKLVCAPALGTLYGANDSAVTGFYNGRLAAWRVGRRPERSRWTDRRMHDADKVYIECATDAGVHGADAGAPSWPVDGANGPWRRTEPSSATWRDWRVATVYSAHYLRWYHFHRSVSESTRLDVVKNVVNAAVESVTGINIGLMRFDARGGDFNPTYGGYSDSQGGYVVFPISDVSAPGVLDAFRSRVNSLTGTGLTPLAETLYEAMLYFRGLPPKYGVHANGAASHPDSMGNGRYTSPITSACVHNHIVFLSDGLPNSDDNADNEINSLLAGATGLADTTCNNGAHPGVVPIDNCLDELADYMFHSDSATESLGNDLPGRQNIIVHTVGFNVTGDDAFLRDTATKGGGRYFPAEDAQSLSAAFNQIISDILRVNTTFTAPAVSINTANRLNHRDELYFTVFKPDDRPHWDGNIKKFKMATATDAQGNEVDADGDGEADLIIVDANGEPAIDPRTGRFRDDVLSFWTPADFSPDGNDVSRGGLASRVLDYDDATNSHDASSRENSVFTITGTPGADLVTALDHESNRLHEDNAYIEGTNEDGKITREMLGAPQLDDAKFVGLLRWARGVDVHDENGNGADTDGRSTLGASLHTRPLIVTYHADPSTADQDDYMFVFTNDGYVHLTRSRAQGMVGGVDSRLELWAFVPPNLLPNLKTLYDNAAASNITYGVDGGVDLWMNDINDDGNLLGAEGSVDVNEHAYLYFGQRRGGSAYYALDVTTPTSPRFLWSVSGDPDARVAEHLEQLGQTWSRPRHIRIFDEAGGRLRARDVVIFGGGYDTGQDSGGARTPDTVGNAIFILDAFTGERLWWAGDSETASGVTPDRLLPAMNYSIPADIRVIDLNGDGVVDRFYTADTGGQIWRFDVDDKEAAPLSERIFGGRIADIQKSSEQASPGAANNRRFYYPPDVAVIEPDVGPRYLSVSIGSGYRAHPNDDAIVDRIYLIKDYDILDRPASNDGTPAYTTLYEDDLLDVTNRISFDRLTDVEREQLSNGWYITLATPGEKVLASPVTSDGNVLVTTYVPANAGVVPSAGQCAPSQGSGRFYALDAENGAPVADLDGQSPPDGASGEFTISDRFKSLTRPGIPTQSIIVFPEGDVSPMPMVGTEFIPELKLDNSPKTTWWYQLDTH